MEKDKDTVLAFLNSLITEETTVADKSIIDYLKRLVRVNLGVEKGKPTGEWEKYFEICWKSYPKKVAKVSAKKMFERKVRGLDGEELKKKATEIYYGVLRYRNYIAENNVDYQYCKYFSSWINSEFEDLKRR